MSTTLNAGDIIVALFIRPDQNSFHSSLAVFRGGINFYKMHARNNYSGIWFYEHGEHAIFNSETIAVLIRIGNLSTSGKSIEEVSKMLEKIPHRTEKIDGGRKTPYDCWIWVRMALRTLHGAGVIDCPNVAALEAEFKAFGAQFLAQADNTILTVEAQSSKPFVHGSVNEDIYKVQRPIIPEWPLRSATLLGRMWTSLPTTFRLSAYRLLRRIGELIWPKKLVGAMGKQRLPFNLFCKYGERVTLSEVLATRFVSENTNIPVPRILDVVYEETELFVLMTCLPGIPANEAAVRFDENAWSALEAELCNWIRQLRSLAPHTDIVGSFLQTESLQRRIQVRQKVGPWPNIAAFYRYFMTLCPEDEGSEPYREFRRVAPVKIFSKNHRLCFTHGDLALHNLLVVNGRLSGLVDFESSGWFPEYWEYTGAVGFKMNRRWVRAMHNIFGDQYRDELDAERLFWESTSGNV